MKIVFFGTSNVALPVLEALHSHHEILACVTNPDAKVGKKQLFQESPVSALAAELHIPLHKPEKVKQNEEFVSQLKSLGADIFIVVSYGKILPKEVLDIPRLKTLNVHFSLLPKYRGASPLQFALLNGETVTGTTIFILDELLDHGPILAQEQISVEEDDTFITLAERAAHISARVLLETLLKYEQGTVPLVIQDESKVTKTKLISKNDGKVDWNSTAQTIYNQFRAFYPWPGIWTTWNDQVIKLLACHVFSEASADIKPPGTVDADGIWCKDGTKLYVSEVQLSGKTSTDIQSFVRGYPAFIGSVLGD